MNYDDDVNVQVDVFAELVHEGRVGFGLERANERRISEAHRLEKQSAEASARMGALRRELVGYLDPESQPQMGMDR